MRIYLDTVGCRLNQSEIEIFARQFRVAGHRLVASPEEADLVVLNTCAVTAAASADSRQKVRQAARAGVGQIAVTGCWATLNPHQAAAMPGVSHVFGNPQKDELVPRVLGLPPEAFDLEPLAREPIPGARLRTRAFIKVQDGCDNRCTFCVTTLARGPGRSRTIDQVLADVRAAARGGAREVVLTGVHLGSWGHDLTPPDHLSHLVRAVLANTSVPRVRLSSLEPWDLDADFFTLWENPRLCRHLHLPLQSGCEATLRRMARKTTPRDFAALVAAIRAAVPDMAITTDIITGFPGETEEEFAQSLAFVRQQHFAGGHVFTYSARSGTAAASMPNQVPHRVRKERNASMRVVLAESAAAYQARFLHQTVLALWESATAMGPQTWTLTGLTDNYLRVRAEAPRRLSNEITAVRLTEITDQGLRGVFVAA